MTQMNTLESPQINSQGDSISDVSGEVIKESNFTTETVETTTSTKEERRTIGRWYIGETLGKGGYSWVKKGYDRKTGQAVALKFMDRKRSKANDWNDKQLHEVKAEIEALKQMKHPNVMRLLAYTLQTKYPDKAAKTRDVILLVLEYMPGGELFDVLYYTSKLDETIARTYFRQLIDGLEACHQAMIVHRDIKPQNLLLDKRFSLKITDFGLAKLMESDNDAVMDTFQVGTKGYQAPEILLQKSYTSSCDIFSAGVVLFILMAGYPPFENATAKDPWYGFFVKKQYKQFWLMHKSCGISKSAKDLITRMIHFDPEKRIGWTQIKEHPWYLEEILDQDRLFKVLHLRHMQTQLKRSRDPIKAQILHDSARRQNKGDPDQSVLRDYLTKTKKLLSEKAPPLPPGESVGILDSFTDVPAYQVLDHFAKLVIENAGRLSADFDNFSIQIRMAIKSILHKGEECGVVDILIRIYQCKEYDCNVVKYHRLTGNIMDFRHVLQFLQENASIVLSGLPDQQIDSNNDQDLTLLKKYFPNSN